MGRPKQYYERLPAPSQPAEAPLSDGMKLLMGHLAGKPWGQPARSAATWRALLDRGLTHLVENGTRTELTAAGRRKVEELDAHRGGDSRG